MPVIVTHFKSDLNNRTFPECSSLLKTHTAQKASILLDSPKENSIFLMKKLKSH